MLAFNDPRGFLGCYMLSQLLDAADGYAARTLGQSSTFGAVLDMVTDRTSTTCLCIVLGRLYPDYLVGFAALVTLDLFSHWFHMYASLTLGHGSHKTVVNPLLRVYYWRPALFAVCAGTELWYLGLYALHHAGGAGGAAALGVSPALVRGVLTVCTPVFLFKQLANVVQMHGACEALVEHDAKGGAAQKKKK